VATPLLLLELLKLQQLLRVCLQQRQRQLLLALWRCFPWLLLLLLPHAPALMLDESA
jgi:hypothetical protein